MKKFSSIFLLISVIFSSFLPVASAQPNNANSKTTKNNPNAEYPIENACLQILGKYVKNDERFGIDLSDRRSKEGQKVDLTKYMTDSNGFGFAQFQAINKTAWSRGMNTQYFLASRNNIGTILSNKKYIATQFVPFGNTAAFNFPYQPQPGETPIEITDSYGNNFKEHIVYMHRLYNDGEGKLMKNGFLSCGFIKAKPNGDYTLADMGNANYKTNSIEESGFELLRDQNNPEVIDGKKFIVGKVNVPIKNYQDENHMTLQLITVAYDNGSAYFNEYETFPLQVKAMTDTDHRKDINETQEKFLQYVNEQTCLQLPHPNIASLPEACNGRYQSNSKRELFAPKTAHTDVKNFQKNENNFFKNLIPTASAQEANDTIDFDENLSTDVEFVPMEETDSLEWMPQGMYVSEGLSYENLQKLDAIGDEFMKAHILRALSHNIEKEMELNKDGDSLSAQDNRTFLQCGMDYATRVKLITEWLDSIDPYTFNKDNITYPDPKIGDCIIPYPDARHKDKVIEGSFLTNQYNAAVFSNNTEVIEKLKPVLEIGEYKKKPYITGASGIWANYVTIIIGGLLLLCGIIMMIFVLRRKKVTNK